MNAITKCLDDIDKILKRDGKTIADLANDLDRDYHQVYDWIRVRKFNPQAEALMTLMAWRDKNISVRRKRAVAAQSPTGTKG